MLKITNLQKTFNPGTVNAKTALNGLNLHIREGDFVTVIGGNGAGKSTLQNAIAGVWKPDFGTIEINPGPHEGHSPRYGNSGESVHRLQAGHETPFHPGRKEGG